MLSIDCEDLPVCDDSSIDAGEWSAALSMGWVHWSRLAGHADEVARDPDCSHEVRSQAVAFVVQYRKFMSWCERAARKRQAPKKPAVEAAGSEVVDFGELFRRT